MRALQTPRRLPQGAETVVVRVTQDPSHMQWLRDAAAENGLSIAALVNGYVREIIRDDMAQEHEQEAVAA